MISGVVNRANEAVVSLTVRGPMGRSATVAAVIDTGFDGALSLPTELAAALQLPLRRSAIAILGDGSEAGYNLYRATVFWDGEARAITVAALDSEPLIGMGLLAGYRLTMQVIPGGQVEIVSLAKPR